MSIPSNDYHGLWRASANEGVPYSEDFPEALLVLPEFIDGALGAGNASIIDIKFNITNPKECELIVNDNGKGLISEKRMSFSILFFIFCSFCFKFFMFSTSY